MRKKRFLTTHTQTHKRAHTHTHTHGTVTVTVSLPLSQTHTHSLWCVNLIQNIKCSIDLQIPWSNLNKDLCHEYKNKKSTLKIKWKLTLKVHQTLQIPQCLTTQAVLFNYGMMFPFSSTTTFKSEHITHYRSRYAHESNTQRWHVLAVPLGQRNILPSPACALKASTYTNRHHKSLIATPGSVFKLV